MSHPVGRASFLTSAVSSSENSHPDSIEGGASIWRWWPPFSIWIRTGMSSVPSDVDLTLTVTPSNLDNACTSKTDKKACMCTRLDIVTFPPRGLLLNLSVKSSSWNGSIPSIMVSALLTGSLYFKFFIIFKFAPWGFKSKGHEVNVRTANHPPDEALPAPQPERAMREMRAE